MFTIADQEKEFSKALRREFEEGFTEGHSEGFTEGHSEGFTEGRSEGEIFGAIKLYRDELGLMPSEIADKIIKRFSLDHRTAEGYIEEVFEVVH